MAAQGRGIEQIVNPAERTGSDKLFILRLYK